MVYISFFFQSNQIHLIFLQHLSVVLDLSILESVYFHLKQDLLYVFQWLSSKKYLVLSSSQSPEIHFKTYSTTISVRPPIANRVSQQEHNFSCFESPAA